MNDINITQIINLYYGNIYNNERYVEDLVWKKTNGPTYDILNNAGYMDTHYCSSNELEILQQIIIGLINE